MKRFMISAAAAALAVAALPTQATVINSAYTPLGSNSWLVDFSIVNDGTPASFAGFTIELPDASNLALIASPGTWDSLVFQPDPNLPDNGFLDSLVIDPSNALAVGQTIGGFSVSFTYAGGALPGPLPFMVYAEDFTPLLSGMTTVTAVPEPATPILAALGLAVVALRGVRARAQQTRSTREVAA